MFGARCQGPVNDARAFFPWTNDNAAGGYVLFHSRLAGIVTGY